MARTNLCPNPGLKNDATGFFGGGTRVTGATGMVRTTAYQNAGNESTLPRGTVTAGLTYRYSAYIKGTGGASSGNANINWYAGGTYLSSAPGQGWVVTTGNVTRVESGAQVAPAGATQGLLNISGVDAQIQVTGILYEQTSNLFEFFDGDTGGCSWVGTDGSSTSTNPVGDSGGDTPPPDPGGSSDEAGITQSWGTPIYSSDFNNPAEITNPANWGLYDGPGHAGNGTRDPERISVTGGLLRIQATAGGSSGGMAQQLSQQYGRWEVRCRAYSTGGTNGQEQYHPVLIIWPDSEAWPDDGEYDFWEVFVGDPGAGAFLHYPHPNLPVQQEHATKSGVSPADWHNYAFEWQPGFLKGYIDGVLWYTYSGGAGPAGRRNIQTMPSGSLRIQLDNFGGSPHRPANMDMEWVRVWDNASVASSGTITCTGIPSPNQGGFVGFGSAVVGNRFRLYLNNSAGAVAVTPTGGWDQTAGAATQKLLGRNRVGSNTSVTVAETSTSNTYDSLLGQWISDPFTSGGTVQGAWQWCVAGLESNAAADAKMAGVVRVVSGDGATVRGTFADTIMAGEMGTLNSSFIITAAAGTPVAAQVGDRMVVEFGYRAANTVPTSYSMTLRYGGTTSDLEAGFLSPGDDAILTSRAPWVEFADGAVKALFTGQTVTLSGISPTEAIGGLVVTIPPTRALTGVGGLASTEAFGSVLVTAEAAIIAPAGISEEAFGTTVVTNAVIVAGVATLEAFGSLRVRRLSDIDLDAGIASTETFGALVVVHFQSLDPSSIDTTETFGNTTVEDPHRPVFPFSAVSAEAFGFPILSYRARATSIGTAESFGKAKLSIGFWRLVQPVRTERWRLGDPGNVIYVTNVVGLTVYGDDAELSTIENPKTETLDAAKYVWQGGHDNITQDQAIRDLWLANGYQVEMSF